MKLYRVVGSVTLSRFHPSYAAASLRAVEALDSSLLNGAVTENPDLVVVWDELGAGLGSMVAVSDGAEAAQPFRPELKAVDAYCSAILDAIHIDPEAVKQLNL